MPKTFRDVYSTKGTPHWDRGTKENRPCEENRPQIRDFFLAFLHFLGIDLEV